MGVAQIVDATVVAQDGGNYRLHVTVDGNFGSQMTTFPVDVLIYGFCDGVRGNWPPLPAVGTKGRVSFTQGDYRNGVWLGAYRGNLTDSCSHSAANPNLAYSVNFDGSFFWHGPDGTVAFTAADGTSVLLGAALPQPTRHTLSGQARQVVPFGPAQRNPNPPAALPFSATFANGVTVSVTSAGAVAVNGLAGQAVSLSGGGCSIIMAGGIISLVGAVQASSSIYASGEVTALAGAGQVVLGLHLHQNAGGTGNSGPPVPGT